MEKPRSRWPKWNPKNNFGSLKELDRHRKLCLGQPVPIHSNKELPWGYKQDPNDPTMAIPIDKALRLLPEVQKYLEQYSYEDMAQWLTQAGYPITYNGLHKLMHSRVPFKEIYLPLEERMKL